ncbi:MAG: HAMP domain-containing histidine kinase [Prevotella sp.]|nr:HAMP domain-containing histidine kinase [Prevotella sp.]
MGNIEMGIASEYALFLVCSAVLLWGIRHILKGRIDKIRSKQADKQAVLHHVLQATGDSVVMQNVKNNTAECVYGNLFEGIIPTEKLYTMFHPGDSCAMDERKRKLDEGHTMGRDHIYRFRKPGEENWGEYGLTCVKRKSYDGKSTLVLSAFCDLTDRMKKERKIRELQNVQKQVFDLPLIGMAIYTPEGNLLEANTKMRQIFKYRNEKDEFYYTACLFDLQPLAGNMTAATVRDVSVCHRVVVPQRGVDEFMELRMCPIYDKDENVAYIIVMARHFDEERALHRETVSNQRMLNERSKEILGYEQDMKILFEYVGMRVCKTSKKDRVLRIYDGFDKVYKELPFDLIYKYAYSDEDRKGIENLIAPPEGTPIAYKEEVYHLSVDMLRGVPGDTWYTGTYIPLVDKNGNIEGVYGLIRNSTRSNKYRKMLELETQKVQEIGRRKTEFLANMTHEIRTPLNSVIGFCDLLVATSDRNESKEYIRIINRNCRQLSKLIDDLLEISALDSSTETEMTVDDVEMVSLFKGTCKNLERLFSASKLEFRIDDAPYEMLHLKANNKTIVQVITNFVDNAVKFTSEGHVRVGWRLEGNEIYIYCEDTGIGIPKDKQEIIYERFMKLNDFIPGTGVGLSICKGLLERIGGTIGVESEGDGKGSTFWARIPCEILEKK